MTARPGAEPRLVVDVGHPGPSEADWWASPDLRALPRLDVPPAAHVVVVAPHPDDEILGAGGILQVLAAAGARIEICAVTDGEASHPDIPRAQLRCTRTAESKTALHCLGLGPPLRRDRLAFPDGRVAGHEAGVADHLVGRLGPGSLCLAPWRGDGHPDHDACGRAAAAAAEATGARLVGYLVWAWHWADPMGGDLPWSSCRRLDLDRRQTARKRWATTAFRSQIGALDGSAGDDRVVLPTAVLRRFWRPFEVFVT